MSNYASDRSDVTFGTNMALEWGSAALTDRQRQGRTGHRRPVTVWQAASLPLPPPHTHTHTHIRVHSTYTHTYTHTYILAARHEHWDSIVSWPAWQKVGGDEKVASLVAEQRHIASIRWQWTGCEMLRIYGFELRWWILCGLFLLGRHVNINRVRKRIT